MPERGLERSADAILRLIRGASAQHAATDRVHIREETIDRVMTDGRATIRGYPDQLPTKSPTVKLATGQRVHVMFKGNTPKLILGHHWKRAQPGLLPVGRYAVEELLLIEAATDQPAGARWDVYFRNDQQVTRLNLHAIINADRQTTWSFITFGANETGVFRIGWGQADNTFWVMTLAHDGVDAASSRWWPRFYTFRLSRPKGEPAGGAAVSATLMATVDMPVFQLPSKYSAYLVVDPTPYDEFPATFPYIRSSGVSFTVNAFASSEIILQPNGAIVMVTPYVSVVQVLEEVTYLFAVRSDTAAILWESPVTDAHRVAPAPFPEAGVEFDTAEVRVLGFAVMEWDATDASKRRVAVSWQVKKFHDAVTSVSVVYARRAVFIENGTALPVATIQPWTDFQTLASGLGEFVEAIPARVVIAPASTDRVLLTGVRNTSVSPSVVEARIEQWASGTLTLLALQEPADGLLPPRAQAVRLFPSSTVYVITEDAAGVSSWPPVAERGRFTLLAGTEPLDVGVVLPDDSAHRGPLAALPAGVTAPDALTPQYFAYHVVGTIT